MRRGHVSRAVRWGALATVLLGGCIPAGCASDTSTGTDVATVVGEQVGPPLDLPVGAQCPPFMPGGPLRIGTSVAIVPASAIDETITVPFLLATSCDTTAASRFDIYYTNPATSTLVLTITAHTSGGSTISDLGFGSLSLRGDRGDLLACTSNLDGHHDIYKIDIKTGLATFMFATPETTGLSLCDGSGWDAENDVVYVSPDVSRNTYIYSESGSFIRSFAVPADCPGSGLAISGEHVYQACDGAINVYQLDKATDAPIIRFVSGDQRTEDLECDPFSFASVNKDVIWTKEAFEDRVFAFEIPRGTCNIAGVPTPPGATPPPAPDFCCPGPACCPLAGQVDTDGDGLLDCWETNRGIDFDGNCSIDLTLDDPDVNRKDLYVELDYMFNLQPNATALANLGTTFDSAPVHNVSRDGIHAHFLVDEEVTTSVGQNFDTEFVPCTAGGTTNKTFDAWKSERFGTATERSSPPTMGAKRLVFRYGLVVQRLAGQPDLMGCAEVPGDDFVIAQFGFKGAYDQKNQEGVILHELGHVLGRRHGGGSNLDKQPNYLSVMNDSLTLATIQTLRAADLSRVAVGWSEIGINEANGIPQGGASLPTVWWNGNAAIATLTNTPTDFDFNGTLGTITRDVTNDAQTTVLLGGDDWSNIHLNLRDLIDYAPATHLTMLSNVEVPSTLYFENSPDEDGDGINNVLDNCVFVPNADQADLNHNGIGDACDVRPTLRCITHKAGNVIAHFGYVNDGFAITAPLGNANSLVGNAVIVAGQQPTIFQRGTHPDEFAVSFDHKETVTWTVNGVSVTADKHGRNCNAVH